MHAWGAGALTSAPSHRAAPATRGFLPPLGAPSRWSLPGTPCRAAPLQDAPTPQNLSHSSPLIAKRMSPSPQTAGCNLSLEAPFPGPRGSPPVPAAARAAPLSPSAAGGGGGALSLPEPGGAREDGADTAMVLGGKSLTAATHERGAAPRGPASPTRQRRAAGRKAPRLS